MRTSIREGIQSIGAAQRGDARWDVVQLDFASGAVTRPPRVAGPHHANPVGVHAGGELARSVGSDDGLRVGCLETVEDEADVDRVRCAEVADGARPGELVDVRRGGPRRGEPCRAFE